jgi:hypothetical protein
MMANHSAESIKAQGRLQAFLILLSLTLTTTTSPAFGVVKPSTSPWIRTESDMTRLALDPKGRFVAFVEGHSGHLKMVDTKSRDIHLITKEHVGGSFVWAPDGFRLFYRELSKSNGSDPQIQSRLKAWDAALRKSVLLDTMNEPSGLLTFDPRDLRLHLMRPSGILTKRISFPGERLALWQVTQRTDKGRWVATQNGMIWLSQSGLAMRRLEDDKAPLESFSISPDGTTAAWATVQGKIFVSREGSAPRELDQGRDPVWHPNKPILLYAGARLLGRKVINHDLKVSDLTGSKRFVTASQFSAERWPQWTPDGNKIIYTVDRTTDIFTLDFTP